MIRSLLNIKAYHAFSVILLGPYDSRLVLVICHNFSFKSKSLGQSAVRA
jgi:hypothetical protein